MYITFKVGITSSTFPNHFNAIHTYGRKLRSKKCTLLWIFTGQLTPSNPVWFQPKSSTCLCNGINSCRRLHCTIELFKPWKNSPSLLVCNEKNFFGWELWCQKWRSFLAILAHVTWPRAQPLDQSILLRFHWKLGSSPKSFEPLIDFLAFLV